MPLDSLTDHRLLRITCRFVDLRREWTSHARGHIDSAGHFKFRGYHGTYVVQLATATGKVHKTFSVEKGDTPLVLDMNL